MPDPFDLSVSPPPLPLSVHAESRGDAEIIACEGSFAVKNHKRLDDLADVVLKSAARTVVIDMRKVVFMDSVGVGTLAMICKHNFGGGKALRLVPNDMVRRMLTLSCLDQVLPFFKDVDEAVTAPAKSQAAK